ncbi:hypothetical protein HN018_28400 (plasmid) [Lichenicola cladoniae]|uniref:Uncharacterized protein n=1 Tax=Lichenicola cladoniae TaxID=1484109 RepID=A0A6M8I239_9PROT|nr:hypothetical protein [Lichenicola cladoniae]NPD69783.1 hypothetical protein [Acetobacteraceae bacterium]QKE94045.1 hypothetical protein HN018_28400 [Lichenicola cladoniae]
MPSQSGVFVLQNDGSLVAMQPTQFAAEVDFQELLSKFPELLVGDQIDPGSPRRFVLVKQEQAIGHDTDVPRWSVDHLFLDQDGIPTLVEVKRKSDTRLRREVVGQMLDYASNCQTSWTAETMRASLEETCESAGTSYDDVITTLLDPTTSLDPVALAEAFWTNVKTNLQAGKVRMLFVADEIPTELRRIVEFLNEQMDPAEILAIELRQFTGQGLRTIVPMIFGQTQEATTKKKFPPGARWTEEHFLAKIDATFSEPQATVARAVLDWMKETNLPLVWGTGRENGSVYPLLKPQGVSINPAYLSTDGKIWLQLGTMQNRPVFGDLTVRRELLDRFGRVAGSGLKEQDLERTPGLSFAVIAADPEGLSKVIAAFNWLLDRVKQAN